MYWPLVNNYDLVSLAMLPLLLVVLTVMPLNPVHLLLLGIVFVRTSKLSISTK